MAPERPTGPARTVSSSTVRVPFITRDTVAGDTPARAATSAMVDCRPEREMLTHPSCQLSDPLARSPTAALRPAAARGSVLLRVPGRILPRTPARTAAKGSAQSPRLSASLTADSEPREPGDLAGDGGEPAALVEDLPRSTGSPWPGCTTVRSVISPISPSSVPAHSASTESGPTEGGPADSIRSPAKITSASGTTTTRSPSVWPAAEVSDLHPPVAEIDGGRHDDLPARRRPGRPVEPEPGRLRRCLRSRPAARVRTRARSVGRSPKAASPNAWS